MDLHLAFPITVYVRALELGHDVSAIHDLIVLRQIRPRFSGWGSSPLEVAHTGPAVPAQNGCWRDPQSSTGSAARLWPPVQPRRMPQRRERMGASSHPDNLREWPRRLPPRAPNSVSRA